jgi:hypothetical protein
MPYDCDDFAWIEDKFYHAGMSQKEVKKAMEILDDFCGLTFKELNDVANGVILWTKDHRGGDSHETT